MKHASGTLLIRKFGAVGYEKEICLVLPWWAGGVLWVSSPFFAPGEINRRLVLDQFQPLDSLVNVLHIPTGVCEKFAELIAYFVKDLSVFRVGIVQLILLNLGVVRACVINDNAPSWFNAWLNIGAPLILKTTYSKDWGDWHGWLLIHRWSRDLSFLS